MAEIAEATHRFADAVADCYSAARPPSDELCDTGFALADRVDALAVEVLHRRQASGATNDLELPGASGPTARDIRHLARVHVAALRDAAEDGRRVSSPDVEAAEHLYQAVVTLGRQFLERTVRTTLEP